MNYKQKPVYMFRCHYGACSTLW